MLVCMGSATVHVQVQEREPTTLHATSSAVRAALGSTGDVDHGQPISNCRCLQSSSMLAINAKLSWGY